MKTVWTKGLDKEIAKEIVQDYKGSSLLRERLTKIIEDKSYSSDKASLAKDGYDCPNWAYKQSDTVGYRRALREVVQLIS